MRRWLLVASLFWMLPGSGAAHSLTVSVLTLKEVGAGEFVVSWSDLQGVLDPNAAHLLLRPVFPAHCSYQPPRLQCGARGLSGRLGFGGLGELSSAAIMQIEHSRQPRQSFTFNASRPQIELAPRAPRDVFAALRAFVELGVEHIWLGWDHLAFVLGLLWLISDTRSLLYTITAFTIGHSITLISAALGYAALPVLPTEAVIALSIAFVAAEALRRDAGRPGVASRAPWLVAGAFGLLHGLGFANALAELNLTRAELPLALLGFNLGVELGQLVFVVLALALGRGLLRFARSPSAALKPLVPYALGGLAMFWLIRRVALFGAVL